MTGTRREKVDWRAWGGGLAGAAFILPAVVMLFGLGEIAGVGPKLTVPPLHLRAVPPGAFEFSDTTSLFIPTKWSSRPANLPVGAVRTAGDTVFEPYEPTLLFAPDALPLTLPPAALPENAAEVAETGLIAGRFLGFGRRELPMAPLVEQDAHVTIRNSATGAVAHSQAIRSAKLPPAAGSWRPFNMVATVNSSGLGLPAPVSSSGVPEIDAFFQVYLSTDIPLGALLKPGTYEIHIEP